MVFLLLMPDQIALQEELEELRDKIDVEAERRAAQSASVDQRDPALVDPSFQTRARRLASCSADQSAPSDMLLIPLLLILMMVFFMYRKPIQEFFTRSNSGKTTYGGLRMIHKKAPVRHS